MSINSLAKVEIETINKIEINKEQLIAQVNSKFLKHTKYEDFIGENNLNSMKKNHTNHINFVISLWKAGDLSTLDNTLAWVFKSYLNHGFKRSYFYLELNFWLEGYKEILEIEEFNKVKKYYFYMLSQLFYFEG